MKIHIPVICMEFLKRFAVEFSIFSASNTAAKCILPVFHILGVLSLSALWESVGLWAVKSPSVTFTIHFDITCKLCDALFMVLGRERVVSDIKV